MLKSDAMQKGEKPLTGKSRQRKTVSCTECRRRKQKCNQARDRPCNNCARRYPPVECLYGDVRNSSRSRERLGGFEAGGRGNRVTGTDESFSEGSRTSLQIIHQPYVPSFIPPIPGFVPSSGPLDEVGQTLERTKTSEHREVSSATREHIQTHSGLTYDISPIFLVDGPRPDYRYQERFDTSMYGTLNVQVGDPATEPLNLLPIDATRRNAELLHFFVQRLSPFMSSIDGNDPSPSFTDQWITFMIQSPLVAYLTILSASYFQATARRIDVEKSVDAIAARMRLNSLINEHITNHSKGVNDEAIAGVMSLAYNELIYSDKRSVLAHMSGLRSMIRTRGGIENIPIIVLRKLIARTDYQVACTFECDPFVHESRDFPVPVLRAFPYELDNPLLQSSRRFSNSAELMNISPEAARILDDMRFLTTSIHAITSIEHSQEETTKFLKTVLWIHEQLSRPSESSLANDYLYQTCRTTAIIYSNAIVTRTPLSKSCTAQLLQRLWMTMWRVPLPHWKRTPGIFLWVLLVVNPFARDKPEGRFIKGMIAAGIVGIGLVDWDTILATLKSFLAVQKWLEFVKIEEEDGVSNRIAVSQPLRGGLPAWSITE